ncbi:MAG: DUF4349 domain-containing protein [Acetatifactor sp.]
MKKVNVSRMKRKTIILTAALSVAMLLQGCGNKEESDGRSISRKNSTSAVSEDMYTEDMWEEVSGKSTEVYFADSALSAGSGYADSEAEMSSPAAAKNDNGSVTDSRKLIKNVSLEVETKEYETLMPALEQQIQSLGGYIDDMETYNGSRYSDNRSVRHATLTARIPQAELNQFLGSVSELCNVVRRNDSVNDVTMSYVDTASRRDALRTEHTRLLELMEQAESLEDILVLEDRLTSVRYQLECMESQLRTMDNQVDYSTVRIRISEVEELTPVQEEEEEEETLWQRMTSGLQDTLEDMKEGLGDFLVCVVSAIPYLLLWTVVIIAAVVTVRCILKKRKQKKATANAEEKRE